MASRNARSSLTEHCFPAFYACYLLKSVRTPRSTATYIGSTPSPPRRIRQHNGEITQGAWKTKHNRPWVMQMIVHGFPSKLAALQFEWAWQHPYISRHLKDGDGKAVFSRDRRNKYLKNNVQIACSMVASHPYNTWPLHVKLFTEEAAKAWFEVTKDSNVSIPLGLSVSTELEGVHGRSGKIGSGRTDPINVTDESFTSEHLKKASSRALVGGSLRCSICDNPIDSFSGDPLNHALCPSSGCMAVSHLRCLADDFLKSSTSAIVDIIPRGGTCRECHSYVLWGDVIRGCYRRAKDDATAVEDPDTEEENERQDLIHEHSDASNASERHLIEGTGKTPKKRAKLASVSPALARPSKTAKTKPTVKKPALKKKLSSAPMREQSSAGEEFFNLNAISSDDESDGVPLAPSAPKNSLQVPRAKSKGSSLSDKARGKQRQKSDIPRAIPLVAARQMNAAKRGHTYLMDVPGEVDFFALEDGMRDSSKISPDRVLMPPEDPENPEKPGDLEAALSSLSMSSPAPSDKEDNDIIIISE
ncbi:unnamed protein product [Somion occarium]|uniref:GIY-YIG domain-containing protein n=1 Tax=Somion occarium TaxID=3059160 RepID=A0ABP1DS84_9APHY